nr:MAG TPA: hypothetical protein [Caudoviricetes sp.]
MLAGPFLLCLTASITVGHATGRERVQVAFQRSKGRSESRTASVRLRCQPLSPIHSSGWGTQPQQAKETCNERQEKRDAEIHTLSRIHRKREGHPLDHRHIHHATKRIR